MEYFINDIFESKGLPKHTYVNRKNGANEEILKRCIENEEIVNIYGLSKTGKSALYQKVVLDNNMKAVVVNCNGQNISQIWLEALDDINACRNTGITKTELIKNSGKFKFDVTIPWSAIFNFGIGIEADAEQSNSEAKAFEKILSDPQVNYLAPALFKNNIIFVIEELQNLDEITRKKLSYGIKTINDKRVSIIIVNTSNQICDLENYNPSLRGKIYYHKNELWDENELVKISNKGLQLLNVPINESLNKTIAQEAVGLPQVVQVLCRELLHYKTSKDKLNNREAKQIELTPTDLFQTLNKYVKTYLKPYEIIYESITKNYNETNINILKIVLRLYSGEPYRINLTLDEIRKKLQELKIVDFRIPEKSEIINEIEYLFTRKEVNIMDVLHWNSKNMNLEIIDPLFLLFLRWKDIENGEEIIGKRVQNDIDLFESKKKE